MSTATTLAPMALAIMIGRKPDAAAAMHGNPLPGRGLSLIDDGAKRGREAAAEAGGGGEVHRLGEAHEIEVGLMDRDIFGERPPMGEARLDLVLTDLLMARMAFRARPAAADEGHRDPVARLPSGHVLADGFDDPGQFVTWNMGQPDIRIVAHPAVPVAAADAGCLDPDNDAMGFRRRIGNGRQFRGLGERLVEHGLHGVSFSRLGDACSRNDHWIRREAALEDQTGAAARRAYSEKWRLRTARTISHTPTRTTGTRPDRMSVLSRASISSGVAST